MAEATYQPISPKVSAETILAAKQEVHPQKDGLGLRTGNKAEFTLICDVVEGGYEKFKQQLEKAQTEAGYWENQIGTVHDLRILFFDGGKRFLFAATYSEDFTPYVLDVIKFASPWFDYMFLGILKDFPGLADPKVNDWLGKYTVQADLWFGSNPDLSPKDITKAKRVLDIFNELLDVAQG